MLSIQKITWRQILDSNRGICRIVEVELFRNEIASTPDISIKKLLAISRVDRLSVINMLKNPDYIYHISYDQFELFTKTLFEGLGYQGILTKKTHDEGVDIYLSKCIDGMPHTYIVQCKHTSKRTTKMGDKYLRELLGTVMDKSVTAGIFVTNAILSIPAKIFIKRHASRLFAFGMNELKQLINSYLCATA